MSTITVESPDQTENQFNWPLCYEAENLLLERIYVFLGRNSFARILSERMRDETGTLFLDWVDHMVVPPPDEAAFRAAGFTEDPLGENASGLKALWHPEAMLPRVLLDTKATKHPSALAIRPEFVAEFVAVHGITNEIEGEPFSRFRKVLAFEENDAAFYAIERRGYRGYATQAPDLKKYLAARELWQTRRRRWDRDVKGYAYSLERLQDVVDLVGPDLACHLVFEEERAFWQKRNRAGIEQKRRQDSLGLGWANHDQTQEAPVARATARFVRVTPMKARRVVDLIRYLPTDEALALLRYAPQSASEPVAKVVASAVANAEHNLRLDPAALVVSAAYVDEGPTLKRIRPRAQGRAFRINKRTSHITVEVSEVATSAELAQKSRKARRDTGQSGPATQQQKSNTRGGTR